MPRTLDRKCHVMVALSFTLIAAVAHAGGTDSPWEHVSTDAGIEVLRRPVAGSNLKEFLGRGVIEAPIGRVLAVIRDGARRAEWMPDCASSYVVEEDLAARVQIAYHRTKAPWPVSDRDSINRAEMHVEPARHRVYIPFEAIDYPKLPPIKGVVRMPFLRGHWILVPLDHGRTTQVEYQVHADPGGSLPDWLANLASNKLPRFTIAGLRTQVRRREYPELEAEVQNSPELKLVLDEAK